MLVTFKCKEYGEFTMVGEFAERLIRMMGHSGAVPGAIAATDIPDALKQLKSAIDSEKKAARDANKKQENKDDDGQKEPPIGIEVRAYPLIEMLTAADRANCEVMWHKL